MSASFPCGPERSRVMSHIPSKDTKPELALRKACHATGLRYRLHRRDLPGTPDFAFTSARIAVFVDGDFWHGRFWFEDGKAPVNNREAWIAKFERNHDRDCRVDAELLASGWVPIRLWASYVMRHLPACVRLVRAPVRLRETRLCA